MEQSPLRYKPGVNDENKTPAPLPLVSSSHSAYDNPHIPIPWSSSFESQVQPGDTAFRLLFPDSVIRAAYGDAAAAASGSIVIADGTDCKPSGSVARVLESVPNCDQRVVLVISPDDGNHDDKGAFSSAQHALIRVYDKLSGVERRLQEQHKDKGSGVESTTKSIVLCNMLAPTKLIGALMGRKGAVIQDIRARTGTRINVFPSPSLPPCAAPGDELIQISGAAVSVRKAIVDVSFHLQAENRKLNIADMNHGATSTPTPAKVNDQHTSRCSVSHKSLAFNTENQNYSVSVTGKQKYSVSAPDVDNTPSPSGSATSGVPSSSGREILEDVSFRMLCSNDSIGRIIGRGGSVVHAMEKETGTAILVSPPVRLCNERVITICASENQYSSLSPAQDAVCRVFTRSEQMEAGTENGSGPYLDNTGIVTARLLVPYNNIGCIMGVGGSIISEIRRKTSTHINVISGNLVPPCAAENDQVVKVSGLFSNVLDALFDITTRLRQDIFKNLTDNASTTFHSTKKLGNHKPAERHLGRSHNGNHRETVTDNMDHLRPDNDVTYPSFPRKWECKTSGTAPTIREAVIHDFSRIRVENGKFNADNMNYGATFPSLENVEDHHSTCSVSHTSLSFNTEKQNYAVPAPDKQKFPISALDYNTTPCFSSTGSSNIPSPASTDTLEEISFRLLCSIDAIGRVIGRGGSIVQAMEKETCSSIRVSPPVHLCGERVITICASEDPHSNFSPAQDAVCRVFTRSLEADVENGSGPYLVNAGTVTARLLVPYNNIGCIMGVGGSIISDIRRKTSTHIIVISGPLLPTCVSENDRVVKVSGLFNNVLDALFDITTRLRKDIFVNRNLTDAARTEFHSAKSLGSYKPSERHCRQSHCNGNRHEMITDNTNHLRLDKYISNSSFPHKWANKDVFAGNHQRGSSNQDSVISPEAVQRGSEPFLVTNTTLQIAVPANVIGKIYGDLVQIKEISGAEVAVQEPTPGGSEGMVTISGTPDRVFAAKSLLHAFSS